MLQAVPLPGLGGGLNLRDSAELVDPTQAVDCLNVVSEPVNALRGRDGYARFGAYNLPGAARSLGVFETDSGDVRQLVVSTEFGVRVLDAAGARIPAGDHNHAGPHWFARLGDVQGDMLLAANGVDPLARWTGAGWSSSGYTGLTPNGKFIAVSPRSSRVVMANFAGDTSDDTTPSTVRWSDPENPLAWQSYNYTVLTPGDGEEIMGVCTWRELTFVFKQSRFFVFGAERTGGGGRPNFDFQPVDTGAGLAVPGGLGVAPEGVYFVDRDGVYLTNGGPPVPVSDMIEPLFSGRLGPFYDGQPINQAALDSVRVATFRGQVAVAIPTTGVDCDRLLLRDARGAWTVHGIPTAGLAVMRAGDDRELFFGQGGAVMRYGPGYRDDNGVPIECRWFGGFDDLGREQIKVVRELEAWGIGQGVRLGLAVDYEGYTRVGEELNFGKPNTDVWGDGASGDLWGDGAGTDTWGGALHAYEARMRQSAEGSLFALRVDASESGWTIYRLSRHVRVPRAVETMNP